MNKLKRPPDGPIFPEPAEKWSNKESRLEFFPSSDWYDVEEETPTNMVSYRTIRRMRAAGSPVDNPTGQQDEPTPASKSQNGASENSLADKHFEEGLHCWQQELPDEAIEHFEKALVNGKKQVNCYRMTALCYIKKENYSEAIEYLKAGLEVTGITDKETLALNYKIGQCYDYLEHVDNAIAYYSKTAESDPEFRNVSNKISSLQKQRKRRSDQTGPVQIESREEAKSVPATPSQNPREPQSIPLYPNKPPLDTPLISVNEGAHKSLWKIWVSVFAVGIGFFLFLSNFDDLASVFKKTFSSSPLSSGAEKNQVVQIPTLEIRSAPKPENAPPLLAEGNKEKSPAHLPTLQTISRSIKYDPGLRVKIEDKSKTMAKGSPVFIISGTVINSSSRKKSGVIVEGQMVDKEGNVLVAASAPCGRIQRYKLIRKTHPGDIDSLYEKGGQPFNCSIERFGNKKYQLIFRGVPKNVQSPVKIKTRAGTSS